MVIRPQHRNKVKDKYLKKNVAGYWIAILSLVLLFVGLGSWMLFGSYNLTVTGYADVVQGIPAYVYVQSEDIDKIKPGMTVSIGNSKGKVANIVDGYLTYDDFFAVYGVNVKHLHIDKNKSYYEINADITEEPSGYLPYTIIYKTITPLEYFLGQN